MQPLWMCSGIVAWAAHFATLYGFTGLACARGIAQAVPWVAGSATTAALVALVFVGLRALPRRSEFTAWMTLAIAGFGAIGVIYQSLPLLIVSPCA